MAVGGVGGILLFEELENRAKCTEVPETALAASITHLLGETMTKDVQYRQNNATCHKSADTMEW